MLKTNNELFAVNSSKGNTIPGIEKEDALKILDIKSTKQSIMACLFELAKDESIEEAELECKHTLLKCSGDMSTILSEIEDTDFFTSEICKTIIESAEKLISDLNEILESGDFNGAISKIPTIYYEQIQILNNRLSKMLNVIEEM